VKYLLAADVAAGCLFVASALYYRHTCRRLRHNPAA
jgi:hypothetical protein